MRDASVIVATSNRAPLVTRCVECLCAQRFPRDRYEIIVVDDGSDDDTAARLAPRAGRGDIVYVRRPSRSGSAAARNAGIAAAGGNIVIFVDSDAFAPPSFVGAHVAAHAGEGGRLVDGPAVNVDRLPEGAAWPFTDPMVRAKAALGFFGAPFVTANASVSRSLLTRAGGFDEAFGDRYGWEDTDLYLRLRRAGGRRVRARAAWLLHLSDATRPLADRGRRRFDCGVNAARLYAKHPSRRTLALIDMRVLRVDRWLACAGFGPGRVARLCESARAPGWRRAMLVQAYLTQCYAAGLRAGDWGPGGRPGAGGRWSWS